MMIFLLYVVIIGAGLGAAGQRILPARKTSTWLMMLSGIIGSFLLWLAGLKLELSGNTDIARSVIGAVIAIAIYWRMRPVIAPNKSVREVSRPPAPASPAAPPATVRSAVSSPQPSVQSAPGTRPADIFISYASADRPLAHSLAKALQNEGWSVWWDRVIPPGKSFDAVIEEALDTAKCVVVLWSSSSVLSDWVKVEASEAARRRILIPALSANVTIPLEFRRIQAASLIDWTGSSDHPGFQSLTASVRDLLGAPR
jgi:uncharacterized membrane protein YeaQ/YmgE (transglycosylase-associated protein family)